MIKNLRKKFILVAMCSTFGVLLAIMGIVNIVNYVRVIQKADEMTLLLAENGGGFKEHFPNDSGERRGAMENEGGINAMENESGINAMENESGKGGMEQRKDMKNLSPETPYATRFFTVTLDADGEVMSSNMGRIAAVSEETAEKYAKKIFGKDSEKGFRGIYRYRTAVVDDEIMIIFLDCRQDLESFRIFALTSLAVSALGLLAVFILVMFFSRIVFRPVEESYEKQKRFITDASHEIKTPLTIIDANTEVLEMENGENQWTRSTKNQVKRLSSLTQQLITLSKLEEKSGKTETARFSLSEAVADTVEPFDTIARVQGKTLDMNIEPDIYYSGDEKAIRQLVGILMDNAVKYSPKQGEIQITLKGRGKKCCLEVWNQTGEIPQGNRDVLFERFYRMDNSRNSETGGSGIGLSVAKAIVSAHKGKISAYSDDGKSLRITVEL